MNDIIKVKKSLDDSGAIIHGNTKTEKADFLELC